jgi:stage V sporulation protein R
LLAGLTNHGRPIIRVVDGNYRNRGELLLTHDFEGIELRQDYAQDTLVNLHRLWRRPVHVATKVEDHSVVLSFDGRTHETRDR